MRLVACGEVIAGVGPTFSGQEGFASVIRVGAGAYRLTLDKNYAPNEIDAFGQVTGATPGHVPLVDCAGTGPTTITVTVTDNANVAADLNFQLLVVAYR